MKLPHVYVPVVAYETTVDSSHLERKPPGPRIAYWSAGLVSCAKTSGSSPSPAWLMMVWPIVHAVPGSAAGPAPTRSIMRPVCQHSVLLAVDQQLGEGATLWVAPELSDPLRVGSTKFMAPTPHR
jgi:hypothetical protein